MALLVLPSRVAWGQRGEAGEAGVDDAFADQAIEATQEDDAPGSPVAQEDLPEIGEDQLAIFVLQRGFYFASGLGVFMTMGGTRGYSNIQPYMTIKGGFDISDLMSVQLAVASGYASGNPISRNDLFGAGGQEAENYGLFNAGLEVVGALRVGEQFAFEFTVGGGVSRIYPALTSPSDISTVLPTNAPYVTATLLEFKYLTLLTDFTAGIAVPVYVVFAGNTMITSGAACAVVRYTF